MARAIGRYKVCEVRFRAVGYRICPRQRKQAIKPITFHYIGNVNHVPAWQIFYGQPKLLERSFAFFSAANRKAGAQRMYVGGNGQLE